MGVIFPLEQGELADEHVHIVLLVVEELQGMGERLARPLVVAVQAGDDAAARAVQAGIASRRHPAVGLLVEHDVCREAF